MRKNQFRSILLAALVVTAIGGLNSCKDYDDDIAELRNELRTNSTDLSSLVADKVHNLEIEANNLQAQLSSLETAYKNADAALQTSINNAVADAKSAAAGEAASKAEAAKEAANSYADLKAAEAQRAAIAAATTLVTDAQNALKSSIDAANATLAEQGKTITGLLQADKELQQGITTATARANEAYTLASQALDAAKAAQAAAEKAQGTADEAKLQAAQNATNLATIAENLKNAQETLNSQINVFGQQVTSAAAQAAENKAKIEGQATQLADMKAANQKAQDAIDALGNKVNDQVEALKGLITANQDQITLLQNGLDAVKGDVTNLQTAVAGLIAADNGIQTKIDELFGEASARIATLTGTVGTNEAAIKSLQDALTALQNGDIKSLQDAVKGLEGQIKDAQGAATEEIGKATAAVNQLKGQLGTLQGVVDALTANAVSQTDIDNAVNALATTVGANYDDLKGQIEALKGGIPTAAAMAAAADAAAKAAADAAVAAMVKEYDLSGINASIAELKTNYSSIDNTIAEKVNVAKAELEATLKAYVEQLVGNAGTGTGEAAADGSLQAQIDELATVLYEYLFGAEAEAGAKMKAGEDAAAKASAISKLKDAIAKATGATTSETTLSSITLIPDLYINGIEALQFKALKYQPYAFDKAVENQGANYKRSLVVALDGSKKPLPEKNVDNGLTTAYYRLSPMTVKENDIKKDEIKFYGKTAKTETRSLADDAGLKVNNPIKPASVQIENGILAVKMQKTVTGSLHYAGEGNPATLVSLMVPRADGSADIYSEFSLIDESDFKVHIAAENLGEKTAGGKVVTDWATYHEDDATIYGHYAGYQAVYGTNVDDATFIKKQIAYNETYDLIKLVAGCDDNTHAKYSVAELKSFGLTFEFSIPTDAYTKNAANGTDQQQFAKIDGSVISSKLPNNVTNNRAAIDKAPIVRVLLKNGSDIVDEAYFKIKWVSEPLPPTPELDPVTLDAVTKSGTLSCNPVTVGLTWKDFINNVYGATFERNGETVKPDLSYDEFKTIYPAAKITTKLVTKGLTTALVVNTTAPDEDAQVASWTLNPDEFGTILPAREKTVEAQIIFKSDKPTQYPDLILPWKYTVKLPAAPAVNGYNTNYWFATGEKLYVLPVQYNTLDADEVLWNTEVKYDYNIMQAFVTSTKTATGTYKDWILKNVPSDCGTWDLQFKWTQSAGNVYHPAYAAWDAGKKVWTGTEPLTTEGTAFADFGAYQLQKDLGGYGVTATTGLRFRWLNAGHTSWQNREDKPFAVLNATKADKDVVKDLLNDLSDENEADGWTPKKTNTDSKAIDLTIWAKYNAFNVEKVTDFKAYLVTPIRINHSLNGAFENGHISGTVVDAMGSLNMTDFRGYLVRKTAPSADEAKVERTKYTDKLYNYYGLTDPTFDIPNAKFGLKIEGGNMVAVNSASLSADEVKALTAGGMAPSLEEVGGKLVYKNMGGHEPDFVYNVYVPVTITHAFGAKTSYIAIPIYPKGRAAEDGFKYGSDGDYVKIAK